VRRRILRWISGGADSDDSVPVANLIAAAAVDFVIRAPNPRRFSDDQLRGLGMPVLAFLAGRSVMLNATRAANRARKVLRDSQVELWSEASHAINGEFPDRIAERAQRFWAEVER
jgi:pimeloyl-ACP methyl ester carboxylesterase